MAENIHSRHKGRPLVSVIITNYNGMKFIRRCVESVLGTSYPDIEVIVVDNASNDGSFELVERLFSSNPRIRMFRSTKNLGHAASCNFGFRQSRGEFVVFMDSDTYVEPSWLANMIRCLERDPTIGVAQPLIYNYYNKNIIDSAGQNIDFLGYGYSVAGSVRMTFRLPLIYETFYADGVTLLIRRDLVKRVGINGLPFDEDYFLYYDDADVCWRIRLVGYKVAVIKSSVIYHARGARNLRNMTSYFVHTHARNRVVTLLKNYDATNLLRYLPVLLVMETIRLVFLLPRNARHSAAIISAFIYIFLNLRKICFKRRYVQNVVRRIPDSQILKYMHRFSILDLAKNFRKYYQA